jgi:hypothetical protein
MCALHQAAWQGYVRIRRGSTQGHIKGPESNLKPEPVVAAGGEKFACARSLAQWDKGLVAWAWPARGRGP